MVTLEEVKNRLLNCDLVPSRVLLLEDIAAKFNLMKLSGITSLKELYTVIKNKKKLTLFSINSGIDLEYLTILKREISSYIPKKIKLKEFQSVNRELLDHYESMGITNSIDLYNRFKTENIKEESIITLFHLVQLTRIQWVSPLTAEMFIAADYNTPMKISESKADIMSNDLKIINSNNRFFIGNIGLRDVERVIYAAQYIHWADEF